MIHVLWLGRYRRAMDSTARSVAGPLQNRVLPTGEIVADPV